MSKDDNKPTLNNTTKIIICTSCEGTGKERERMDMYESGSETCHYCEGSGRLERTVTVRPYEG